RLQGDWSSDVCSSDLDWREFSLRELLREMDKQVLADGADFEASTGYHGLKVELFLYSFVLCHINGIDVPKSYWSKLRAMIEYQQIGRASCRRMLVLSE